MLAKTAIMVLPNTLENSSSFTGESWIAGKVSATVIIKIENIEAKIPTITIRLAFFLPYISLIKSVIKKVIGYGRIPTERTKRSIQKTRMSKGCQ